VDRFEEAVMEYISADPNCLFKSQMNLPYNKESDSGGSLPDFVVINFKEKCVYVVEVTTASNTNGIVKKISERETRWYQPLKEYDADWVNFTRTWEHRVCLFIRPQLVDDLSLSLSECTDVSIKSLGEVMNPWEWEWDDRNQPVNSLR